MKMLLASALVILASGAQAQGLEQMRNATSLGNIIGSAEACELEIDTAAVAAWIEEKVPADDMEFISTLNMMTDGTRYSVDEMSDLQVATHCIQVRRSAVANGLASEK